MIIIETNPHLWAIKHKLELKTELCRKCGREVEVNIPVISKDFVGFESVSHECGAGYRISILKPR
jgi:hypothetical protein